MAKRTSYTLDLSKWRCGDASEDDNVAMGSGDTMLLNADGYMCCLGQFALQVLKSDKMLLDWPEPEDVGSAYDENFVRLDEDGTLRSTKLSNDLININDNQLTTINDKIKLMSKRLDEEGISLKLIRS